MITVVGRQEEPQRYIYQLEENGIMFREAEFNTGKGGKEVKILQITDLHLNCLNARDVIERRPCVMSSREYRMWCKDGADGSVPNAIRSMRLAKDFDQTILTGDTLDYLTWGAIDLMEELVWKVDENALVAIGGHDITRKMQGKVLDDTTLESRYDILQKVWRHDVNYVVRVLEDKVRVVVMNNGESRYFAFQAEKLAEDISKARENGEILLIFQHEPLSTYNEKEKNLEYIRTGSEGSHNFYDGFVGKPEADEATKTVHRMITENADVIKGVFCGHRHSDIYSEIMASYIAENGELVKTMIPQYTLAPNVYDQGHALIITVK